MAGPANQPHCTGINSLQQISWLTLTLGMTTASWLTPHREAVLTLPFSRALAPGSSPGGFLPSVEIPQPSSRPLRLWSPRQILPSRMTAPLLYAMANTPGSNCPRQRLWVSDGRRLHRTHL